MALSKRASNRRTRNVKFLEALQRLAGSGIQVKATLRVISVEAGYSSNAHTAARALADLEAEGLLTWTKGTNVRRVRAGGAIDWPESAVITLVPQQSVVAVVEDASAELRTRWLSQPTMPSEPRGRIWETLESCKPSNHSSRVAEPELPTLEELRRRIEAKMLVDA